MSSTDLSPVRNVETGSLINSLSIIVHWADSPEVRNAEMKAVDFPFDDVALFLTVNQLAYRGALRPTELARILGTSRSNITKITTRLEDADLVVRVADPNDDRGVLVALSSTGRIMAERIVDDAQRRAAHAFDGWSAEDAETLLRLLARMAAGAVAEGFEPTPHGGDS